MRSIAILPAALCLATSLAFAQTADKPTSRPLSRAEVIADTVLWQQSGLAALQTSDAGPDVLSGAYQAAQAEYQRLRSSARYGQLVAQIAEQRGEAVPTPGS